MYGQVGLVGLVVQRVAMIVGKKEQKSKNKSMVANVMVGTTKNAIINLLLASFAVNQKVRLRELK